MPEGGTRWPEPVAWAHRVNDRWIAHHGLKTSARAYLEQLERVDPVRWVRSCERARRLVKECGAEEDPKPWFYAGLFSLVTPAEARRFLAEHWFTASIIPVLDEQVPEGPAEEQVGPGTRAKLQRLRDAVARLGARH